MRILPFILSKCNKIRNHRNKYLDGYKHMLNLFFFGKQRNLKFPPVVSLLILVSVLLSFRASGQVYVPFPETNAIWNEIFISLQPAERWTYQYGISGDTVINNIQYHKIYRLADTLFPVTTGEFNGAIREDNKRIYVIGCNTVYPGSGEGEVVLYDFTENVGDTVFVGQDGVGPAGYLVIDHIDSVLIDNNYRKTFYFTTMGDYYWIEGIGSTRGLFSPITGITTGLQTWNLICHNQDGEVKYLNPEYSTCFPILEGIRNTETTERQVDIIPNPVIDQSIVKFDNADKSLQVFRIYSLTGQIMMVYEITDKSQIVLNRADFKPGLYFYCITGYNQIHLSGKLIFR